MGYTSVFWTDKVTILAAFTFVSDPPSDPTMIYGFDTLMLETVGIPFEGYIDIGH
jgi:hypothetical protein